MVPLKHDVENGIGKCQLGIDFPTYYEIAALAGCFQERTLAT